MENGPLILYWSAPEADPGTAVCTDNFARYGLDVTLCPDFSELLRRARLAEGEPNMPVVIILDARQNDDVTLVSTLRALYGSVGIVALVNAVDDAIVARLLHAGADVYYPAQAAPGVLVAMVLRLLWRVGMSVPSSVPAVDQAQPLSPSPASWKLVDTGWALRSPSGKSVTLTTGERAFMTTLLHSPQQQATHAELTLAVNTAYNIDDRITHQSRMGVMVSRLRRKFERAGVPLPLKSIHNWGYMFTMSAPDSSESAQEVTLKA